MKRMSFGDYQDKLGFGVAERAEILAAMDCLMHHLRSVDDFRQWVSCAMDDTRDYNLLNWDPKKGALRCRQYMELAKELDEDSFECICRTFADIIRGQCFNVEYRRGAFSNGA